MTQFKEQLEEQNVRYAVCGGLTAAVGGLAIGVAEDTPVHEAPVAHVGGWALGVALMAGGFIAAGHSIRMHWQADKLE